ncbi:hypothetical protein L6Q96_15310 [Candidatus Binatia bacterium]|nr:hypothetical protein [Candidatus Binatia bacterium]
MPEPKNCEHCGAAIPAETAESPEIVVVDNWTHYFCSERCKLRWGEQGEIEEEE